MQIIGVKLEDVELRPELFQDAGLPCEVVRGTVQRLHLRVPWKQLLKQPVVLEAAGITLQLREREEGQWEEEAVEASDLGKGFLAAEVWKILRNRGIDLSPTIFTALESTKTFSLLSWPRLAGRTEEKHSSSCFKAMFSW